MFFMFVSYLTMIVGTWVIYARLLGSCCGLFWNCCHVIAIIVTAAYRFDSQGKLCALNDMKSAYDDNNEYYLDEWTYEDDGRAITAFWVM